MTSFSISLRPQVRCNSFNLKTFAAWLLAVEVASIIRLIVIL